MTLRVVDLYAGVGGLSAGFVAAGTDVVLAVDSDERSSKTYARNHPDTVVLNEKITPTWNVVERMKHYLEDPVCDILVGGPPCQGWSTLGPRGNVERRELLNACVDHLIDQAILLQPPAVVIENVRGLAVRDGGKHLRRAVGRLRRAGYRVSTHETRAAHFGVPQLRHRVFVVGISSDLPTRFALNPTHDETSWLTVWDAIGDLPSIAAGGSSESYLPAQTELQRRLRGKCTSLTWHEAPDHSKGILKVLAGLSREGSSRTELCADVVPTSGFHNTYGRLWSTRPAPAVTSSAGRISSGRNAHPFDDRALSPREAARLQTFPDNYEWVGERWPVYKQIGNAVPPVLAEAVARALVQAIAPLLT